MLKISDKKSCSGCGACSNICPKHSISMQEDNEGFLYPVVDSNTCSDCGLCEKFCPILNPVKTEPYKQRAVLFQHSNQKILRQSTSGGLFSAIASWIIKNGGVVFGAGFDEQDVRIIKHFYVDNEFDL